ncbi:hypothetical protein SEA_DAUBENSKI_151 [Streptomyces phage Daubenski]|uniref:Uncharacterized protein n=1 Tax=Streptomyces phage Daubenski TaxID=2653725 RepID=A0A5Q2WIQ6_9CAUD|nr:hypothetical protein KNU80_gp135 [Streptomyces phage Daubenski]QGH76437.1 hypothetical protein SEA_DAUBENSKI_151 [Streptomyces phage Daubenski]
MAVNLGDDAAKEAEEDIKEDLDDGRPIKEIVKDAAKAYAKAKGRQAFFAAVKLMKAKQKEQGKSNTSGVKAMQKKASQLRVGDITSDGEVLTVGRSPVDKKQYEVVFMGSSGSDRQIVDQNTKYEVVERRSIR